MIEKITVNAGKPYEVLVGKGLLNSVGELIGSIIKPCKTVVITDSTVDKLYYSTGIFHKFPFLSRGGGYSA